MKGLTNEELGLVKIKFLADMGSSGYKKGEKVWTSKQDAKSCVEMGNAVYIGREVKDV